MPLPEPPPLGAHALPLGSFEREAVIVTGGGTGLGKAIALEFARLGARLAILSRREEHRAAGVAAVEAVGGKALGVACDIRDAAHVAEAFDSVTHELGAPGVLVNNAAGNFPVPAEDLSPNGWRTVVDIVLNGTFYCSREFGRRHIAAATPAAIVNVGASPGREDPASRIQRLRRPA
jgi:NAD(P)-dependent dehydrogenase (short-subunit alcohol dehydrogenase family)